MLWYSSIKLVRVSGSKKTYFIFPRYETVRRWHSWETPSSSLSTSALRSYIITIVSPAYCVKTLKLVKLWNWHQAVQTRDLWPRNRLPSAAIWALENGISWATIWGSPAREYMRQPVNELWKNALIHFDQTCTHQRKQKGIFYLSKIRYSMVLEPVRDTIKLSLDIILPYAHASS